MNHSFWSRIDNVLRIEIKNKRYNDIFKIDKNKKFSIKNYLIFNLQNVKLEKGHFKISPSIPLYLSELQHPVNNLQTYTYIYLATHADHKMKKRISEETAIIERGGQLRFAKSYEKGWRNFGGCNDESFRSREDRGGWHKNHHPNEPIYIR